MKLLSHILITDITINQTITDRHYNHEDELLNYCTLQSFVPRSPSSPARHLSGQAAAVCYRFDTYTKNTSKQNKQDYDVKE